MILNKTGEFFSFNGVRYAIGDTVMATKSSDYAGLFGTITEIRTGVDLEKENDDVDIYCEFYPPVAPYDVQEFEKNMSRLYQTEMNIALLRQACKKSGFVEAQIAAGWDYMYAQIYELRNALSNKEAESDDIA